MSKQWWAEVNDLETAKYRIYNEDSFKYDKVLPYLNFNDKTVLDFGCGIGRNLKFLTHSAAKEIFGFDMPNMLNLAQSFLTEEELNKVQFLCEPLDEFPKVDVVTALIVFQHMDIPTLQRYLQMLSDCLNPGGIMYVMSRGYIDHELGNIWPHIIKYFEPITSLYPEDFSEKHQTCLFKPIKE